MSPGPASGIPAKGAASHPFDPSKVASGIPAGGVRTPFAPGNAEALRHGAYSPRVFGKIAQGLRDWALENFPDLAEPRYSAALDAWAQVEAQATLLRPLGVANLLQGDLSNPGALAVNETILRSTSALEARAERLRMQLGLDPRSHAALVRDRAEAATLTVDLDGIVARGRVALEQRAARGEAAALAALSATDARSEHAAARSAHAGSSAGTFDTEEGA